MADTKKRNNSNPDIDSVVIPAELTENNNLEEYIQPSSLELLKARYGAIEEDEDIRNEGFELAPRAGLIIKQRPESGVYGYFSGPVNPNDEIRTDVDSPLSKVFDETRSKFDSDTVAFSDISFEQKKKDAEVKAEKTAEEVEAPKKRRSTKKAEETAAVEEKPKRTRTTKKVEETAEVEEKPKRTRLTKKAEENVEVEEKPKRTRSTKKAEENVEVKEKPKRTRTTKKIVESVEEITPEAPAEEKAEEEEAPPRIINNRYGFDTHTRVIYVDESADDGIKRNTEEELTSFFEPESNKKKRGLFAWLQRKK